MAVTQYIGSRYVPIFADPIEWSSAKEYEPLTIVTHEGNSYTAKQFVPVGIDIDNGDFWALSGNYNAQVEQYRRETAAAKTAADAAQSSADAAQSSAAAAQSDIDSLLPKSEFDSVNTVANAIENNANKIDVFNHSAPINVLTLGFDNTGANDISTLFNTYTEQFPLYFPCGIYKVSHTLNVKNSVYGAGRTRDKIVSDRTTWFNSAISTDEGGIFNIDTDASVALESFNVYCDSNNAAIVMANNYPSRKYRFYDITIANLHHAGIRTLGTRFSSRLFNAKSISIFGAPNAPSTGFLTTFSSGDCLIEDVEIMGCRVGFSFDGGIYNLNNVHVWCGYIDTNNADPSWWGATRGILLQHTARVFGNNIYLDSCMISVSCTYYEGSYNIANINNLEILFDSTVRVATRNDATLFYSANPADKIIINSGYFRLDENDPIANVNNINTIIENVIYRRNFGYDGTNKRKVMLNRAYVPIKYYINTKSGSANSYVEIARIYHGSDITSGHCLFNIMQGYGNYNVNVSAQVRSGVVSLVYDSIQQVGTPYLYYKDDGTFLHIYALNSTAQEYVYFINSINYSNYFSLVDYANIEFTSDVAFETLTDVSGLTQINPRS